MRYESFYPFASSQSQAPNTWQQSPRLQPYPFPEQMQNPMNQQGPSNPLGGQSANQPPQGAPPGQGPGQGPSKMDAYMQTANQFMNTAQQFAPVVQQFAPMMKNLPAMWRMYKGFQSLPSAGEQVAGASGARAATQATASSLGRQSSSPRIFQPPGR